ncbi:ABC transporter ATP-binding protein [Salinicoccus roseus]|uniref:ABC transporter ATP-binding protein n=1 Tax=Salinicoccus roseus TaxID=45670 RepID=UPI000F4F1EF7|nr:ABC transporter ATP-binding protein [Salinicoccus roseus]RPE52842.1 ABC-2 type transport system ATP-binding protein [Salinicoccus roseus]GGA72987.1 ABC transporter ATP-binding protein [Salinicoccus roseus]
MRILKIEGLKKTFNDKTVIEDLNLEVAENEIYGFIGSNGAGKTTTMKMVLGLLKSDGGEIYVCGEKVRFGDTPTNRHVGYLPDVPEFYTYMNAEEYLKLCADITRMGKAEQRERIDALLKLVGLRGEKARIRNYSRGMKQRLGIAQALIHRPKLLICDEPTSALDPKGRMEILKILKEITKETTVIFSTHILTDVERISDRVGILYEGKIVKEIDLSKESLGEKGIVVEFDQESYDKISPALDMRHIGGASYVIEDHSLQEIYGVLHAHGVYPERIVKERKSLEDVYLEVTT